MYTADTDNLSQNNQALDIKRYLKAIYKYKFSIIFFTILASALVAIYLSKMTPIYKATATILFDRADVKGVRVQEVYSVNTQRREYSLTQLEILKSRNLAKQVIERLNLYPDFGLQSDEKSFVDEVKSRIPFLNNAPRKLSERHILEAKIDLFLKELEVNQVGWSYLVSVSFYHADAVVAANVANAVGEIYIENLLAAKVGVTEKTTAWLTDRLNTLRIRLDESEEKLQLFRERNDLVDVKGAVALIDRELESRSMQLAKSEQELRSLTQVREVLNSSKDLGLAEIAKVKEQDLVKEAATRLSEAELERNDLSKVYGPKHPKMIAANSEVVELEQQLERQIASFVKGLDKSIASLKTLVKSLEQDIEETKSKYQTVSRKEVEFHKLQREVEASRSLYNQFLTRSKETEAAGDFTSDQVRIITPAVEPLYPVKPNKKKYMILAVAFFFAFAMGVALLKEMLNDTFKSISSIEGQLSQRVLGTIPYISPAKGEKDINVRSFFAPDQKKFAEAVRTFRTNIMLSNMDADRNIIGVTSSAPSEGKSTTSINLAFSLAQMGNVLLIDADMRKPSICSRFNIPKYQAGLANVIAGTEKLEDCLFKDEESGITIMPCGQIPPNPLELLGSQRFKQLLAAMSRKFDYVIVDTPPVQAVSDALVISKIVHSTIYVIKSDSTRTAIAKAGLGRLIQAKAKVSGVVLNQFDTKRLSKEDGYHGYYDYYGYGEDKSG